MRVFIVEPLADPDDEQARSKLEKRVLEAVGKTLLFMREERRSVEKLDAIIHGGAEAIVEGRFEVPYDAISLATALLDRAMNHIMKKGLSVEVPDKGDEP